MQNMKRDWCMDMDSHGECSKPKKSKSCTADNVANSPWAYLPAVVLHQIFDLLSPEDRKNASCICRHWRKSLFHPKWWPAIKFKIEPDNMPKAKFYASTFGRNVSKATISLNSLWSSCIYEFVLLLRLLNQNNHLKSLILEPSHCRLAESLNPYIVNQGGESDLSEIPDLIMAILPRLSQFSLGGLEDLAYYTDWILKNLTPSKVTLLGLASIKDDITVHEEIYFEPELISSFTNLQALSIDYDQLSDRFLYNLEGARNLLRLVVHLHAIPKGHQGTSNTAWKDFKNAHPECMLRLTVIHYTAIRSLHVQVLRDEMPLSHLKVFFCEDVNMEVLNNLSTFYARTLRSLMWIDSLNDLTANWKLFQSAASPDPFVLMSWLCTQFEELMLYGYYYSEENLLAISRLRGSKMKKLEIPSINIKSGGFGYDQNAIKEIAQNLDSAWKPMHCDDLHPVILDPNAGDSDEFLLPLVLADLH